MHGVGAVQEPSPQYRAQALRWAIQTSVLLIRADQVAQKTAGHDTSRHDTAASLLEEIGALLFSARDTGAGR
jgi:hypothetical protein